MESSILGMKKKYIYLWIISITLVFFLIKTEILFIGYWILNLELTSNTIVQITPNKYIWKSIDEIDTLKDILQKDNFSYIEQMWSWYFFKNVDTEEKVFVDGKILTQKYIIFTLKY